MVPDAKVLQEQYLREKLTNGVKISVGGSWGIDQIVQNIVLINNSRTTWQTKMLMPVLSFSDNLLQDACIIIIIIIFISFKLVLIILMVQTKHAQFWFELQFTLLKLQLKN